MQGNKKKSFGQELLVDLYRCVPKLVGSLDFNYKFLEDLVDLLEMKKQAPPYLFVSPPEYLDKAGLSGWVPLIESGIQLHTLTDKNFVSIDIYSCREIDKKQVLQFCQKRYKPKKIESQFILRGINYSNL